MNAEQIAEERMKEINRLRSIIQEQNEQLQNGRDYLISVEQKDLKVENALEAFGFGRNGLEIN